jgi:hypothetical protein
MKKNKLKKWFLMICLLSASLMNATTATEQTLDAIVQKNINASGGLDAIKKLGIISLEQIGTQTPGAKPIRFLIGGKDKIKVLEGISPLIEKATVLNDDKIIAKSIEGPVAPEMINKTELYCFSRLISGNFSLYYFRDKLTEIGLKKFGGSEAYILQIKYNSALITFYLDAASYLLNRIVIEQNSDSAETFKTIYDIYPCGDVNGYNIPTGYYKSEMGNENSLNYGYGEEYLFRNYKPNEQAAKDEFDKVELNFGEVVVADRRVDGNVTAVGFNDEAKRGVYYTNIGVDVLEKAGIKEKDTLTFEINGKKYPAVYIKSQTNITQELSLPGKIVVSISARTSFHIVLFYGGEYKDMVNGTGLLTKISIIKE